MPVITIRTTLKYEQQIRSVVKDADVTVNSMYEDLIEMIINNETSFELPESIPIYIPLKISLTCFNDTLSIQNCNFNRNQLELYKQITSFLHKVECTNVTISHNESSSILDFWHNNHLIWIEENQLIEYLDTFNYIQKYGNNIKLLTFDPIFDLLFRIIKQNSKIYNRIKNIIGIIPLTNIVVIFGNNDNIAQSLLSAISILRSENWFSYTQTDSSSSSKLKEICTIYELTYIDYFSILDADVITYDFNSSLSFTSLINSLITDEIIIDLNTDLNEDEYLFNENIIFIKGNDLVREDNISEVYSAVSIGIIPLLSFMIQADNFNEDQIYLIILDAYAKTSQILNLKTFSPIAFDYINVNGNAITLLLPSKYFLEVMITQFETTKQPRYQHFSQMDEALLFRGKLSTFGIRSICRTKIGNSITFSVCWFELENIPVTNELLETINLTHDVLKLDLVNYIKSKCREDMDTVSFVKFEDLTLKELVEVIITADGYGYEMETYSQLKSFPNNYELTYINQRDILSIYSPGIDPMTRRPLISSQNLRHLRGGLGYFTISSILGLYDDVPQPRPIKIEKGHITHTYEDYLSDSQLYDIIIINNYNQNNEKKIFNFDITYTDSLINDEHKVFQILNHPLMSIIMSLDKVNEVTKQLACLWEHGFFLSIWGINYYQLTNKLSIMDPVTYPIFLNADKSEINSDRCLKNIAIFYEEYALLNH
jgi:hypothetical protein